MVLKTISPGRGVRASLMLFFVIYVLYSFERAAGSLHFSRRRLTTVEMESFVYLKSHKRDLGDILDSLEY